MDAPVTSVVSTAALATLSTGIVMVRDFAGVHQAAAALMGHPVWTHEFPGLADRLRDLIVAQLPDFPTEATSDNFGEVLAATIARYGETVEITRGSETREAGPVTTLLQAVNAAQGVRQ